MSPQPSSSDFSSATDASVASTMEPNNYMSHIIKAEDVDLSGIFPEIDDSSLWFEPPLPENTMAPFDLQAIADESQTRYPFNSIEKLEPGYPYGSIIDDGMEFWYKLFIGAGGSPELSEF